MRKFGRSALACSGAILLGALAGCSGGTTQEPVPGGQSADKTSTSEAAGPEIKDARDATAVQPCQLLPAKAAQQLGFVPKGEKDEKGAKDSFGACEWEQQGNDATTVTLEALPRSIQTYYDNKSAYQDFAKLTIAGHPAVRANLDKTTVDSFCNFYVATKDGQVISGLGNTVAGSGKPVDPCKLTKDTLAAAVPSLPKAQ